MSAFTKACTGPAPSEVPHQDVGGRPGTNVLAQKRRWTSYKRERSVTRMVIVTFSDAADLRYVLFPRGVAGCHGEDRLSAQTYTLATLQLP